MGEGHYNKAPIMDHWNAKAHSFELTYIGTANSARRFMPPYLKKSELKLRHLMRNVVVYSDYASLIAYTPKDYKLYSCLYHIIAAYVQHYFRGTKTQACSYVNVQCK